MCDELTFRLIVKAELAGWIVAHGCSNEWEFQKQSPAGEDFYFIIEAKDAENVWYEVKKAAKQFDIYDHAEARIRSEPECTGSDMEALVNDAYDIQEMMEDLAYDLREVTKDLAA